MLRAHVEFLASDSMAGRLCPSRSCELTADYVLAQFLGAGLTTQVQTTEALLEIRRGDVFLRPLGLTVDPKWLAYEIPAKVNAEGSLVTPTKISIPKSSELDAVYNATGPIAVTVVPAGLRNVIGVVRGRDPVLRDTYVLVTAHYDHIGEKTDATGDSVNNGANDNASGISALIEIARAIAAAPVKPRRSIAFIAFFGEESGLVGSRYYAKNPVFPIAKTYAQVNFEQLGRTDDTEGPRVKAATVTGWDRSSMGAILARAAKPSGVRIYKHEKFSDAFFERSDNEALAKLGVPAHTVSVAYGFPDYHDLGDEAGKLDYANMRSVARALRSGVVALANRTTALPLRPPGGSKSPASR
ncbi:MAG: M20/M25/M40 family metallo-hydrolase [Clostridia bacterium]|nr:M20/M25/M40 family metallo-hydrolase [Deltaproteobacteria bacterium]